jgi:hypothetical protein
VHTLAQARTSTAILRLDAEHNESVTHFLIDSGLAVRSEPSAGLLSEIALSHATLSDAFLHSADLYKADLSDADLSGAFLSGADLTGAEGITNEELEQQAATLDRATMPDGQMYEDWLKSRSRGADGENSAPS